MGNPGLLQELPDISALLPQGGGDCEQSATTDGTAGGLDAKADFALDDGLEQGPYSCGEDFVYSSVVGGFEAVDLKKGPQGFFALQQLMVSAHGLGPIIFGGFIQRVIGMTPP